LKQIAEELGIGYIRRWDSTNAKAGNLNFALSVTSGDFILQLDSDHVPLPNIIHQLLGYFNDERVAFVQTPQDFYNTDSFTHVVNDHSRSLWEENRIFYSLLQPGKDHWNASFFCGSGGMLRRSALQSIGGFSTNTIIEDMETSLKLHSSGWKSVYHPEALAFGLSPTSAGAFHVQRMRWAQGSMQILKKMNPLFLPGLSAGQRVCYLAANLYPLDGLQKAVFYLSPVIFLFTGLVPVAADGKELMLRLLPYLVLSITAFELLARGTGYLFISERYNMAKFFTYIMALTGYFAKGKLKFNVTPKGVTDVPFRTFAAQLFLLVVSLLAVLWAPVAHQFGWVNYQTNAFDLAFIASAMWVIWNVYFAAFVVRMSLRMQQQRSDHRFLDALPVRIRVAGSVGMPQLALTHDLNPLGVAFRSTQTFEPDTELEVDLPLSTRPVAARGRVVHVEPTQTAYGTIYLHGVRFSAMPLEDRDAIELHCTQHSVPMWRKRYRQSLDFFSKATEIMRNSRGERRRLVQLPAQLRIQTSDLQSEMGAGLLEEVSEYGARLLVENPIAPGTAVSFDVPGTRISGSGTVVFSQALESPMSVRFIIGLKLSQVAQLVGQPAPHTQPLAAS
jgi:cellulose synthase (UDP-forming)